MARWNRTGTATVTNGSANVTGTTTAWLTSAKPGDHVTFDAGVTWYEIATVTSNTAMTLGTNFTGTSGAKSGASGLFAIANTSPAWSRAGDLAYLHAQHIEKLTIMPPVIGAPDAGKFLVVNGGGTAFDLATPGVGPAPAVADANKYVVVNGAGSGLVYATRREILTASRTYFVRTDGNNANTGLTNSAGGAFATIQQALNTVATLDLSIYNVTIQLGIPGTYSGACVVQAPFVGSGVVTILGSTSAPQDYVMSHTGICVEARTGGAIRVSGVRLTSSGSSGIYAQLDGFVQITGAVEFGPCAAAGMVAETGGIVSVAVSYTIAGGGQNHMRARSGGLVRNTAPTITLTGTPAFAWQFAYADRNGLIESFGNTFSGSATGSRYSALNGSGIFVNGGGASYFPGSSAGSATSPGWYA